MVGLFAGSTGRMAVGRKANATACIVMVFSRKRLRQSGNYCENFCGNAQYLEARGSNTEPPIAMTDRSPIMSSVHAAEMHHLKTSKDSETLCESPLCDNRFPQTGLRIEPRRFCSDRCRQQASLIRRVGALLNDLPDEEVIRILRKSLSPKRQNELSYERR